MTTTPDQITACLVTRGDTDLTPIINTLPYPNVVIWDNSQQEDFKVYGRYEAAFRHAKTPLVYFQDDDIIFTHHTELINAYEPGKMVANYAHGHNDSGYGDLPLVGAGAIVDWAMCADAVGLWNQHFPIDHDFLYDCDFALGILTPHKHIHLPYQIRDNAYNGARLADEPWQRETKLRITNQARWIRDHATGPSQTVTEPVTA